MAYQLRFSTPTTERIPLFNSCSIPLPKRDRSFSVSPTFPVTECREKRFQVEPTRSATATAMLKIENNTSGRARLWDTALKFLCPGLFMTSPDHLDEKENKPTVMRLLINMINVRITSYKIFTKTLFHNFWKSDISRHFIRAN